MMAVAAMLVLLVGAAGAEQQIIKDPPKGARNVLMIIVDDLRPEAAYFNESFSEHTHPLRQPRSFATGAATLAANTRAQTPLRLAHLPRS